MTEPEPGTLDDEPPEAIRAAVAASEGRRRRRGDRVLRLPDGPRGVVEGWKGDRVLVLWGTFDSRPVREWVPADELALDSGETGQPS